MSAMLDKIDELLEQLEEFEAEQKKPKFEVTDKSSAEWVLRKIAQIKGWMAENNQIAAEQIEPYKAEIAKIEEWNASENNKLQKRIDFLQNMLYPYHLKVMETDSKAKTIKLPHGELKMRKQQPEISRNDEVLLDWLIENEMHDFVKVKKSPDWEGLKKDCVFEDGKAIIPDTGQIIDGVTVTERPDKFEVVVK